MAKDEQDYPASIGPYEIRGEIARGGMARVLLGWQPSLEREVAIKVLEGDSTRDEAAIARFEREAKSIARLSHPGVIQIFDFGAEPGLYYIVMELVDGHSLDALLRKRPLKVIEAVNIALQVARSLEHAHGKGIVHRDIKPANVLVQRETGQVKVTDFGIAHLAGSRERGRTLTSADVAIGTVDYMAPEQRRAGSKVDQRADIFSFGVMLYEMIAGRTPVGRFRRLHEVRDDTPPRVDALVQRCLAEDPEDRYQNCTEIVAELSHLSEKELAYRETISRLVDTVRRVPQRATTAMRRSGRAGKRVRLLVIGVLILVGGGLLVTALLNRSGETPLEPVARDRSTAPSNHAERLATAESLVERDDFDGALNVLRDLRTTAGKPTLQTGGNTLPADSAVVAEAQWRIAAIHEQRGRDDLAGIAYAYFAKAYGHLQPARLPDALYLAGRYKLAANDPAAASTLWGRFLEVAPDDNRAADVRAQQSGLLYQRAVYLEDQVKPPRGEKQAHWRRIVALYQRYLDEAAGGDRRADAYWRLALVLYNHKEVRDYARCVATLQAMENEFPKSSKEPLYQAAEIARDKLDDDALARQLYTEYLKQQPDGEHAPDARRRLGNR